MKGQTQALTAVLITTVTVGTVATAYVWGAPLLEKRQSKAELDQLESNVIDLRESIVSTAQGGSGTTEEVALEMSDGGRLEVNPEQDYIDITTSTASTPYPAGTWTLLEGSSLQNLTIGTGSYASKSTDLPGVVAVRAASSAGSTVVTYRIEMRNLYAETPTGPRLEKIDLVSVGRTTASGEVKLLLSNEGASRETVEVATGETLPRRTTEVSVDIQ